MTEPDQSGGNGWRSCFIALAVVTVLFLLVFGTCLATYGP